MVSSVVSYGWSCLPNFFTPELLMDQTLSFLLPFVAFFILLAAHNWQTQTRIFFTCPCNEIYREEAVGLKSSNYT